MAMDRRTAARQIATKLIASRARDGIYESGPIAVERTIVEEYIKEYTQKREVPLDERMERELNKYGITILDADVTEERRPTDNNKDILEDIPGLTPDSIEILQKMLTGCTEREAEVLRMRFGMCDGKPHTLQEVAEFFGVTAERIRQIENKAIRKHIHHRRRVKQIKDFYE